MLNNRCTKLITRMVGKNEKIFWAGKPNKKCFILETIFNPLLPFALIWGIIDFVFLGTALFASDSKQPLFFLIPFFAIHLMPVWIYLGGIIFSFVKYKNTEFMITDKGIYISGGVFVKTFEMKPFTDLSHVNLRFGIFDQLLGVGDVVITCEHVGLQADSEHSASHGMVICDIPDYQRVFNMVKELQTDIYADTMYPNDLRPATNRGYRTEYKKGDQF